MSSPKWQKMPRAIAEGYSEDHEITPNPQVTKADSNDNSETDQIWNELKNLQDTMSTMDKSYLDLPTHVSKLGKDLKTDEQTRLDLSLVAEKNYDTKISVFTETIHKEIKKQIDSAIKKVNSSLDDMKRVIAQFKISIQTQINDFLKTPLSSIRELKDQIISTQKDIEKIDFEGLSQAYALEREERDEDIKRENEKITAFEKYLLKKHGDIIRKYQITKQVKIPPISSEDNTRQHFQQHHTSKNATKIIMCFDSNRKFINFRKLWTLDRSKRHTCSTLK